MEFATRARFVLSLIGIFTSLLMIKAFLSLNFDPVVYKLRVQGARYLNKEYVKREVMPIGGIHLSKLVLPSDPFIKSYKVEYADNGVVNLILKERQPAFVLSTSKNYFLVSRDGIFLMKLSKADIYRATAYKIFFDLDPINLSDDEIINPKIISEIETILSYPDWFEKLILEVDIRKKTLYFVKGISIKFNDLNLNRSYEMVIDNLIKNSSIGSRYFVVGQNFVHLPNP